MATHRAPQGARKRAANARIPTQALPPASVSETHPVQSTKAGSERLRDAFTSTEMFADIGPFGDSALPPKLSSREVVVWYSDIRGFTRYCNALKARSQDRLIENLLASYLKIYVTAYRLTLDDFTETHLRADLARAKTLRMPSATAEARTRYLRTQAQLKEVRHIATPVYYKNLGDGLLVVWELDGASTMAVKSLATDWIQSIILETHALFLYRFSHLTPVERDSYADEATSLKLGSGVARGTVLRLDFPGQTMHDYAGSIMNLGARLCNLARPEGIVAELGTTRATYYRLFKGGRGEIIELRGLKGIEKETITVWTFRVNKIPGKVIKKKWSTKDIPAD